MPYKAQTRNLVLPETIYGGTVNVETGEGMKTWNMIVLDGTENWMSWGVNFRTDGLTGFYCTDIADYSPEDYRRALSSHYIHSLGTYGGQTVGFDFAGPTSTTKYLMIAVQNSRLSDTSSTAAAVSSWKSYLAAQYAAGTPVQIAYKLAEPVPFTATGGSLLYQLDGINTVISDADTLTVNGRADPIKVIESQRQAIISLGGNI